MTTTDWRLTRHARERAAELGFALIDLLEAAANPELTYGQPDRGPHQAMHLRGDVAVGVDTGSLTIITVVLRRDDRWEHGTDRRTTDRRSQP